MSTTKCPLTSAVHLVRAAYFQLIVQLAVGSLVEEVQRNENSVSYCRVRCIGQIPPNSLCAGGGLYLGVAKKHQYLKDEIEIRDGKPQERGCLCQGTAAFAGFFMWDFQRVQAVFAGPNATLQTQDRIPCEYFNFMHRLTILST